MNHTSQKTLAVWFTVAVAIMLGVAAVAYFAFTQTAALDAWIVHTRDVIDTIDDVSIAVGDIESGSRGYVITGNTSFLEPYSAGKTRVVQLAEKLAKLIQDNAIQAKRVQQLRTSLLERADVAAKTVALRETGGNEQASRIVAEERGLKVASEIRALLSEMRSEEDRLLEQRTQKARNARTTALVLGGAGVLSSLVIIGLVFGLVLLEARRRQRAEAELSAANQRLSSTLSQAERLIQEKRMIDRVAGLLHRCSTLEETREIIFKELRQALPESRGAVYLSRASRDLVEVITDWNEPRGFNAGKSFSPEECWALKSGALRVMRTSDDVACGHVDLTTTEAVVCVPMNVQGESIGVMVVEGSPDQFDDAQLDLIRRLVDQIGMSLATLQLQQRLRDQSFQDPLTGLFNRRYFEIAIEKEISRADRHQQTIGVVMIDVDHFKSINDRYGHEAGDSLLKRISDVLRGHVRVEDIICRYGGEEFLLVLPGDSPGATQRRAETLRQEVEKLVAVLQDGTLVTDTTISLGVAIYPTHGSSWQDVVGIADKALYRAKDLGRNRTVLAESTKVEVGPVTSSGEDAEGGAAEFDPSMVRS
jgi:diguanylate cyclase (GGDEF)-like protein